MSLEERAAGFILMVSTILLYVYILVSLILWGFGGD